MRFIYIYFIFIYLQIADEGENSRSQNVQEDVEGEGTDKTVSNNLCLASGMTPEDVKRGLSDKLAGKCISLLM